MPVILESDSVCLGLDFAEDGLFGLVEPRQFVIGEEGVGGVCSSFEETQGETVAFIEPGFDASELLRLHSIIFCLGLNKGVGRHHYLYLFDSEKLSKIHSLV